WADPPRNKNYRVALFGHKQSDPLEAHAGARSALTEPPQPAPPLPEPLRQLRPVASRLQAVVRPRTRLVKPLHQLLARPLPQLALAVQDLTSGGGGGPPGRAPAPPPAAGG